MSNLQQSMLKAKLAKLPNLPSLNPDGSPANDEGRDQDEAQGEEEEEGGDGLGELGRQPRSRPSKSSSSRSSAYSPLSAVPTYFSQCLQITPPLLSPPYEPASSSSSSSASASPSSSSTTAPYTAPPFQVYYNPPQPPIGDDPRGSVLVCHHGGGEGALGFAELAKEIKNGSDGELGVLSWDVRGHGDTPSPSPSPASHLDLSLHTLTTDLLSLLLSPDLFPSPKAAPTLFLLGHSMGAAPILSAVPELQKRGYRVGGVVVLDVVEGSAMEALPLMPGIIGQRPSSFGSVEEAIEWHVSTQTLRSTLSARLSVPSTLCPVEPSSSSSRLTWKTDLLASSPFWESWYQGLSSKFLATRSARMLVLAGQDRMDQPLMIGQMQGKFQHVVLPDCGHHIQQDVPDRLGELLVDFWRRNDGANVLKGVKKVGEV